MSWPHCFNRVQDQVQDDLLKLNAISLNEKRPVRKPNADRDAIPDNYVLRQCYHFIDCRIEVKALVSRRRFLDVIPDAINDLCGSVDIADETIECGVDLVRLRRLHLQEILGRTSVVPRAADRLCDLVSQRGS